MARGLGYLRISLAELWLAKWVAMPKDSGWQSSGCPGVCDAQGFGLQELWWSRGLKRSGVWAALKIGDGIALVAWGFGVTRALRCPRIQGGRALTVPKCGINKFKMPKVAEL